MGCAFLFVPLLIFVDPGKGGLPESATLTSINRRHPHAKPHYFCVCLRIAELLIERRPPLRLAKISCVQTILPGINNSRCNCPLIAFCEQRLCH